MSPVELLLSKLPGAKRNDRGWVARCPAHDDKRPSLSVSEGGDGRALVHCHAGCAPEAITAALGLTLDDLAPERSGPTRPSSAPKRQTRSTPPSKVFKTANDAMAALEKTLGQRTALWTYRGADGEPVGVVLRWNLRGGKKNIRPVSRTPAGWIIGGMPTPRPLYQLPTLANVQRVFVTEGEKCADAVISLGLIATTSPHGAQSASSADWSPLAGKECILLPDNDKPGEEYAATVVGELSKLTPAPTVKVLHLDNLPRGGDAFDFIAMQRNAGALNDDDIRAHLERSADRLSPVELEKPQPAIESFRSFPVDVLPDRMRVFVEAVAAATGTDPAFAAMAALVVVAGCIGNRVAVLVKSGWVEPAVLWGVLVGRSGTTKSPVLKLVTRALIDLFKAARRAFTDAMKEYQREVERHNVRLAEWKKSQRNGPPTDPPDEPERPIERRLLVSDITVEKLGVLLAENPLGLLLVRDELAGWIGSYDRYASGGRGSDQPAWLSMHDAGSVSIDRKTSGSFFIDRAAVSVLGSIQPGTLARSFGTAEREAGLLARVLVAYPPDLPALWTEAALSDNVAAEWRTLLEALLALPAAVDEDGDPRPRFIPIARKAKALWVEWHDRHARELVDISNDDLAAHYAKLKGACARIALLFACVEVAAGGDAVACISEDAMRRAIAVVEWFKGEGRRVYAVLGESEEDRARRRLTEWIERRGGAVSVRDWQRARSHKTAGDAEGELNELVEAGYGQWHVPPQTGRGRPTKRFVLTPDNSDTDKNPSGGPETPIVSVSEASDGDDWGEL